MTATLKDGTSNSIKIYITKTLDIILPDTNVDVPYEHIYVGAAKQLRGNTVENREYNTDLKAYWTTVAMTTWFAALGIAARNAGRRKPSPA